MNYNNYSYGIVLVTTSSKIEGEAIAFKLLEEKLAACISMTPINSIYTWENKIESTQEWQLMIKTDLNHFDKLESRIKTLHSYQTPEIIALPIVKGSQSYLNWISDNVK
jgi:periplasmic divalent cation tolerance protein